MELLRKAGTVGRLIVCPVPIPFAVRSDNAMKLLTDALIVAIEETSFPA